MTILKKKEKGKEKQEQKKGKRKNKLFVSKTCMNHTRVNTKKAPKKTHS